MNAIKSKADKCIKLADLPTGTMLHKIANANIRYNGYYTYTDLITDNRIFVD